MWYSNRRRCGAWPLFFSPCCRFAPVLGLGLLRRPDGCCRSPARYLAGFSSLGWLAGCSPGSLSFYFRAACFLAGCLGFYASFPPGKGRGFLRLAWRYGRRFWRRSLPLPMVFPWRWGHGVRLYLLGWFAILEVLVLKSRVSPFLLVSSLLAWCLEFWAPVPVAPLPRGALWFFSSFLWSSRAPPDIWPRASVSLLAFDLLVAWSLRLWGDPCLGVQWLSFRGAGVVSFASSC